MYIAAQSGRPAAADVPQKAYTLYLIQDTSKAQIKSGITAMAGAQVHSSKENCCNSEHTAPALGPDAHHLGKVRRSGDAYLPVEGL
jgi:hypothetical protein